MIELLLRLHPRDFRERYGDALREMLALRAAEARREGRLATVLFWIRECAGLLRSALRERNHSTREVRSMNGLRHELGAALRRLLRAPGFSVAAVAMLALGIGATASVYTLLHRVALRPLPYADSERLVYLDHGAPGMGFDRDVGITTWLYVRYGEAARLLEDVGLVRIDGVSLVDPSGPPERVRYAEATASLARVLATPPLLGRWFTPDDAPSVVLSHSLWQRRWGGDPGVIGRSLRLLGGQYEVIGVMPREFTFPDESVELWTGKEFTITHPDGGFNYEAVGRLAPGANIDELRAELQSLVETSPEAFGNQPHVARRVRDGRVRALPISLKDRVIGDLSGTLWMLLGAVALMLLTTWANVANLFLVRSDARRREVAVRRALGAGRDAIARFFLAEGVLLAVAGWISGIAIAYAAIRLILRFAPVALPRAHEISIDANVLIVSGLLSLVAGIALTAIPLLRGDASSAGALRDGGRNATAGRARLRLRAALMAGQVALALMLLAGAGLLVRSYAHVRQTSPGFAERNVLFFGILRPDNADRTHRASEAFHIGLANRVAALPGVQTVGLTTCVPLDGYCWGESVIREDGESEAALVVSMRRVSASYFGALQVPIIAGRPFVPEDEARVADVVVLSNAVAQRLFPGEDPVGRRIAPGGSRANAQWFTVVGVAGDIATRSVMEGTPELVFYLPITDSRPGEGPVWIGHMNYAVRTEADPATLIPMVHAAVSEMHPDVPLARVRTIEQMLAADRAQIAFTAALLLLAAFVSLVLGAIGIYAVFSYVVGRRTAEIGLRLALGASARDVLGIILRQAGGVTLVGVVVGLVSAALLTRLLSSLLFGVQPLDAGVFAVATGLLLLVAFGAAALPARRAWRLRPVDALRVE
jgi:putative ABC transport system permease protein